MEAIVQTATLCQNPCNQDSPARGLTDRGFWLGVCLQCGQLQAGSKSLCIEDTWVATDAGRQQSGIYVDNLPRKSAVC